MANKKNANNPKKQANVYGALKVACFGGEFLSALLPLFVYVMVNHSQYFVEYEGVKYGVSFFMAMALVGITIIGVSGEKIKGSLLSFTLKIGIFAFIVTMIGQLANDLASMLWCVFFGLLGSQGFELGGKYFDKQKKLKLKAIEQARMNKDIANATKIIEDKENKKSA